MRFSAAIAQVVAREPERAPANGAPAEGGDARTEQPVREVVQDPPADLDQRVRLSGEW